MKHCPAQNPNCRHKKEEGRCDYCGFDFDAEHLTAESLEIAKQEAAAIARQRTKDEEKTQQAQREGALQGELAAMKRQMAELLAQTGQRNQEMEALKAQLAQEAKARKTMQARLDEEARKRNAELQAEKRRQEEEAKARQTAEAKAVAERKASEDRQRPGRVFRDADWTPEMVVLPRGGFLMGAPASEAESTDDERPQHRVDIAYPLALGRYAVTNGEYRRFNPNHNSGKGFNDERQPVVEVSWEDAQAYIEWLNRQLKLTGKDRYRLPSESEWEYGCRAGTTGPFSFSGPITAEKANYDANYQYEGSPKGRYREKTVEVGSLPANPWGLHEMHGNVLEWVQDCYHDSYKGAPTDGSAWESGCTEDRRVLRGGSWFSGPWGLRSAYRLWNSPDIRDYIIGFRLARTLP